MFCFNQSQWNKIKLACLLQFYSMSSMSSMYVFMNVKHIFRNMNELKGTRDIYMLYNYIQTKT